MLAKVWPQDGVKCGAQIRGWPTFLVSVRFTSWCNPKKEEDHAKKKKKEKEAMYANLIRFWAVKNFGLEATMCDLIKQNAFLTVWVRKDCYRKWHGPSSFSFAFHFAILFRFIVIIKKNKKIIDDRFVLRNKYYINTYKLQMIIPSSNKSQHMIFARICTRFTYL